MQINIIKMQVNVALKYMPLSKLHNKESNVKNPRTIDKKLFFLWVLNNSKQIINRKTIGRSRNTKSPVLTKKTDEELKITNNSISSLFS